MRRSRVALVFALGAASCGGDGAATNGKSKDGVPGTFSDAFTPGNEEGCDEKAKLVYGLNSDDGLYSFDPAALAFKYRRRSSW